MRWPGETVIQDDKDGLGMDDSMVRTWLGWHHHRPLCILAHHYLGRVQKRLKGAPALTIAQARLLIASVLPLKRLDPQQALERVRFIQRQNYAAYLDFVNLANLPSRRILAVSSAFKAVHLCTKEGRNLAIFAENSAVFQEDFS